MKRFLSAGVISSMVATLFLVSNVEARGGSSYYRSAKTGQFVTKSYNKSHPTTTIKSKRYR